MHVPMLARLIVGIRKKDGALDFTIVKLNHVLSFTYSIDYFMRNLQLLKFCSALQLIPDTENSFDFSIDLRYGNTRIKYEQL